MDRVLAIEGIELVGINNRDLGMSLTSVNRPHTRTVFLSYCYDNITTKLLRTLDSPFGAFAR